MSNDMIFLASTNLSALPIWILERNLVVTSISLPDARACKPSLLITSTVVSIMTSASFLDRGLEYTILPQGLFLVYPQYKQNDVDHRCSQSTRSYNNGALRQRSATTCPENDTDH